MGVGIEVLVWFFLCSNWKKVVYCDINCSVIISLFLCNFDICIFWIGVLLCSEKCFDVFWVSDY